MGRNTRNSQAAAGAQAFPLAVVSTSDNPANDNNVPPVSSASSSLQPSSEFLTTVVQAVKSALAAEQQAISSSETSPVSSAPFQATTAALALPSSSGGVPALHSQALALVAPGASFVSSAGSSAFQASSVQFRLPVVPSFVSTFSNPLLSPVDVPSANMAAAGSTLPLASVLPQPPLHQPFIVGPGISPISGKLVGQIVTRKFVDLGDLLPTNSLSSEPEPQILFDGRLVLTPAPKKPKRRVEDITTWVEAFSIFCLVLTSYFPHRWKDLLQYQLLILRTYRQFNGRVWLAYYRALREHAAASHLTDWSSINVQLFKFSCCWRLCSSS